MGCFTPASLLPVLLLPCLLLQFSELGSPLNDEGEALLRFREAVEVDPYGFLANWVEVDGSGDPPCSFAGVLCEDGRVVSLNLENLRLKGKLAPELQNLAHLRHLILNDNYFYGIVPMEIGELQKLEILNLSYNNLHGSLPPSLQNPKSLPFSAALEGNSFTSPPTNTINGGQRSLLQSSTTPTPSPSPSYSPTPSPSPSPSPTPSRSPNKPRMSPPPTSPPLGEKSNNTTIGTMVGVAIGISVSIFVFLAFLVWFCKSGKGVDVMPLTAATTLSGQLQQAFIKGVPALNHEELREACEDFSNEVGSLPDCILFKGTLSSGTEIAVIVMKTDNGCWDQFCQDQFRNMIETLSKVNHKNFVNLIGYCQEENPFSRMLVFEYASNGSLYEHIHPNVGEREHLSWLERMRIGMGVAYFLLHISRLDPPHILQDLSSRTILLTDDLAAKVSHLVLLDTKKTKYEEARIVHMFGVLMLELITGRKPYSTENGDLVKWSFDYLNNVKPQDQMLDWTLTSFQISNVRPLCQVIKSCLNPNPIDRPLIQDVVLELHKIIGVSHMSAAPRTSPLWWAELEILSSSNPAML